MTSTAGAPSTNELEVSPAGPNGRGHADLHAACRELFERTGIHTVQFGCPDVDGLFRGKRVPATYFLDTVAHKGSMIADILFGWDVADTIMDGLEHSGWHTGYRDLALIPDLATVRAVPWEPGVATAICDVRTPDGAAVEIAPRRILQRQVERAAELGHAFAIGYELEFYLFKETPYSVIEKGYRDLVPATPELSTYSLHRLAMIDDVIGDIRDHMNAYGIPIEASNTEYGPGQIEVNIEHCAPLDAADRMLLYKDGVRQIAARHGYVACFMAKLSGEGAGSSGHIHHSMRPLEAPDRNAFWDPDGRCESQLMRQAIAGELAAMPELTLFHCPTVNSYKRKVEGSWAPTSAAWGRDNRTTALRVIAREAASCRLEHRLPGADANPYLAIAACIAGALDGIERGLLPPEPIVGNAYAQEAPPLPASLEEAIAAAEAGAVARSAFGPEFVEHFLATRRWERDRHREAVSDWELTRYFGRI
jgi:glutamine synthetase